MKRSVADERGGSAREALLEAAASLFGERGPAAVSTREIAAAARVNNGLIHRHFGTKDELLRQTLERLAAEIAATAESTTRSPAARADVAALLEYFGAASVGSRYWRLLARCLLDGKRPDELQTEFPTIRGIAELLADLRDRGTISPALDTEALALLLTAAGLGWLVFEPFLLQAAAADRDAADDPADARERVRGAVRRTVLQLLASDDRTDDR